MPAGVFTLPGPNNVFVPNHAASQGLVVAFHRNVNDFSINQYCQIVECPETIGLYLEMTAEEAGRVLGEDEGADDWPDGAPAPNVDGGGEEHRYKSFQTRRKVFQDPLGELTQSQASWNIVEQKSAVLAQKAMTKRTRLVVAKISDSANYNSGHYSAVDDISGNSGTWAQTTVARQDIARSLDYGFMKINRATLGAVKRRDLRLVISPECAAEIAKTPEVVEMLKSSVHAKAQIQGDLWEGDWRLPQYMYGIRVIVEDCVQTTSKKGAATATKDYVLSSNSAVLVARPGGLMGHYKSPSFSSVTLFVHKDGNLVTETMKDTNNKRAVIRVIDNRVAEITSPLSSFLFTGVLS